MAPANVRPPSSPAAISISAWRYLTPQVVIMIRSKYLNHAKRRKMARMITACVSTNRASCGSSRASLLQEANSN